MKVKYLIVVLAAWVLWAKCGTNSTLQPRATKYERENYCEFAGVSQGMLGVVRTILESNQIQYSDSLGYKFMCLYNFRFPRMRFLPDERSCDNCLFLINPELAPREDAVQAYYDEQRMVLFRGEVDDFTEATLRLCDCTQETLNKSLKEYAFYWRGEE